MVRVPKIKIVVNGADKTSSILQNLVQLSLTDYANDNSDQIEIEIAGDKANLNMIVSETKIISITAI